MGCSQFLAALCMACGTLVLSQGAAHAQPAQALRIHGFGTVGMTVLDAPDDWGMRRSHKQRRDGASVRFDVDSRLGLQANYALGAEFELVVQALLQQQVRPDALHLAFLAWRPHPDLTLRAGRTNNDVVLLSESRDVGFSYPWVRPNHDAYGPLPLYTLDGVDATWQWRRGPADWKLHGFAGRGTSHVEGATGSGGQRYDMQRLLGLTLSRDQGGLHLRATVATVQAALGGSPGIDQAMQALTEVAALPVPTAAAEAAELHAVMRGLLDAPRVTYAGAGLSMDDGGPWIFTAEAMTSMSDARFVRGRFGYASVGRRVGPFTLYAMAGVGRFGVGWRPLSDWNAQLAPVVGRELAAAAALAGDTVQRELHGGAMRQRSLSIGTRWDVHPRAALKLQLDRFTVDRAGSLFWTTGEARSARPVVGSLVLDFIF